VIGLDIRIKNEYNSYLKKIFAGIDLQKYDWEIIFDDTLYKENGTFQCIFKNDIIHGINKNGILNGHEFNNCISKENYIIYFVDIKAYPTGATRSIIKTFSDFMESNCELVLICVDSVYVEVYCKNSKVLETIYNNCLGEDFEKVDYVSFEDASGRTLKA
jgi:hypothetical protein